MPGFETLFTQKNNNKTLRPKMRLLKITNIKHFMNKLLLENAFDNFLISEAVLKTNNTFIIDGHINPEFYSAKELDMLKSAAEEKQRIYSGKLSRWYEIKPTMLSLIKGNKSPLYFKISLYLSDENVKKLFMSCDTDFTENDTDGFSLILKYSDESLIITSSVVLKVFSFDRSVDKIWDDMVCKFLGSHDISYEIM